MRPRLREMVWGGQNLARLLDKPIAPNQRIGETWEAWEGCVIENGAHRGATLGDLIARDATAILGTRTRDARLPLLFKFIDAHEDLSVQVHPNDAQARELENYPFGKTEAWYVLHAEPDACLIHGFNVDMDATRVRALLTENRLHDALARVSVQRGDVVFVPAGTVHAILRGIVLAEIQENSDITYRLYDWGRQDAHRPLHIEQSLRVLNYARQTEHKIPSLTIHHPEFARHILVACHYFSFERWEMRAPIPHIELNDTFNIVTLIAGAAEIVGADARVSASRGQTILLPARLGAYSITPRTTACELLRMYVPDLHADLIEPLTRAGYRAEEIARTVH
ncbi:MAG: class I mannose-6-phosphate isomerase [Anaerolineae bacterium]|nr:class I mannose-6-phosphate isomerase [Anaerolineae bacterium]